MTWASIKAWLSSALGYLVTAAIAIPALASLYLWGKGWRSKARGAERAREAAEAAAAAATGRLKAEQSIRRAEAKARATLRDTVDAQTAQIVAQEAGFDAIVSDADRFNRALILGQTVGLHADDD